MTFPSKRPFYPANTLYLHICISLQFIVQVLFVFSVLMIAGCSDDSSEITLDEETALPVNKTFENYVETGDYESIIERGKLRVLLAGVSDAQFLPREGLPVHYEVELITRLAADLKLDPVWIYAEKFEDLIPMLLEGKGDVIASNLTVTEDRKQKVAFSVPVTTVHEQLIVKKSAKVKSPKNLAGKKVALMKSTSFWESMEKLKARYPKIELEAVGENNVVGDLLDGVATGKYFATVADSNLVDAVLPYLDQLEAAFNVSDERAIAWAVRPDASELAGYIDRFLIFEQLAKRQTGKYHVDLPEIKKRKVLRVLTRNNAATYFLWRGELMGFEYELTKRFAKQLGVRLEMIVAPSRTELYKWLSDGKGDMIAASLTIPDDSAASEFVYTRSYHKVSEILVARSSDDSISKPEDLKGRTVHVRQSGSYWKTLQKLKSNGIDFTIKATPENEETEEALSRLASGKYDLTVSDSHILDIELTWRDDIKGVLNLSDEVNHGWVMRKDSPQLLKAANGFIKKEYRGLFYNITRKKYFEKQESIAKRLEERVDKNPDSQLSPYDEIAKKYGEKYGFDWRMVISQMYQESRFNPDAKSWAGALGLMQVMPRTGKELGIKNLRDPESSVEAGVKYLDWLRDRFEPELSVKDRMWFVLASYNAGTGHVRDARRLASQKGWHPNRWFDNVEKAMLLLSQRKYASKARHGFVRGQEPVNYVRHIRDRYLAYVKLTEAR